MTKSIVLLLTLCAACLPDSAPSLGQTEQGMISLNGISLNGISLNGISLNGTSLSGLNLNAVNNAGVTSTGAALVARSGTAQPWSGAGTMVGSTWTATSTQGTSVKLRVDAALAGAAPNSDLWFYAVSYQTSSGWSPLCGLDATNRPIQAVSVPGVWSPVERDDASYAASATQFTLACRGKTIGKCMEMGYKPYKGYLKQLASCVRMLRGDYCGTGTAHTIDGTTINVYDNVGVQADTQAWPAEAEWGPSGALCISSTNDARYEMLASKDPLCVARRKTATCGTSFANGAILIDELAPDALSSAATTSGR